MEVDEARRLRALEEENARLKRAVADLTVRAISFARKRGSAI